MRTINLLLFLFVSAILFSCGGTQKMESDELNSKSYNLDTFQAITVTQGIEVVLHQSTEHRATASSNFLEYLRLEVSNEGVLVIDFDQPTNTIFKKNLTKVEVWAPNVNTFKASSSGSLKVDGKFNDSDQFIYASSSGKVTYDVDCKNIKIEVSSSGNYVGKIKANTLNASVSSSGNIDVKGNARTVFLQSSSSGDFNGRNLEADGVDADISSGADVYIGVRNRLTANVSSGGSLNYRPKGTISMDINKSSGGRVKEIKGSF